MTYTTLRILTYVLGIVGSALALPLAVAALEGEREMVPVFAAPMAAAWAAALVFRIRARGKPTVVGVQDAFGVVGAIWMAICVFGAVPLYFSGAFASLTDALFESVSGFTTTGATVLADIEALPRSVNLWRCETHWLGGMGVVALGVAMIPLLGAGGYRLIKAEATGPDKGKFTATITATAKVLWFVYFGFTAVQALILWRIGLDPVDSLAHAFSTLGTGGFSTRNESLGAFGLPQAEWTTAVFMLLSSVSYVLYCRLFTGRFSEVRNNTELKVFVLLIAAATVAVWAAEKGRIGLRDAVFQVASIVSSTGFMTSDYTAWLPAGQAVLLVLCFVGGCSGSSAGGVKVVRWTLLARQFANELRRLVHPYGIYSLRLDGVAGREGFVPAVASFVFAYLALVMVTAFFGALSGLDMFTAFTAGASMVGNVGPAFGALGPTANYGELPTALKWWYMFAMLAGRLEIYTLLITAGFFIRDRRR